jgi:hypothetical protein
MLPYLLLTAALGWGQPDSVPPAGAPAPAPRGALTLEAEPPALQPVSADQPVPAAPAPADKAPPKPVEFTVPALPPPPAPSPAAPAAAAPTFPDRWLLMKELQGTWIGSALDGSRTQIYGWFDFNYTFSSVGHTDLPESFNYRGNEPTLEQLWVRIQRPVVNTATTTGTSYAWPTPTTEPTFGFQSDWIIGTDYRFTLPQKGILNDQLTDRVLFNPLSPSSPVLAPNIYGVDPVQFYGEAYFPTIGRGLDVKVGRFYTPYGTETLEAATMGYSYPNAVSTPLVSHSYIFSNGSPFTHTGVLATLTVTPVWTVQAGLVVGDDLFFHPSDRATGIFTIQWTQPQGTQSVSRNVVKFCTIAGPARFDDNHAVQNIDIFDVVWTHYFNPLLASNLEALYGFEHNVPGSFLSLTNGASPTLGFIDWGGVAGYLTYIFTPRFSGCARLEVFDDPSGVRTSSAEDPFADRTKGLYAAATVGGVWKVRKGLYVMPEVRYDYNFDSAPFGTTVDHPFDGHHGMLTAGSSLILRW